MFPAKAPDIVIDPPNGSRRVVHHGGINRYFRLGLREADFLEMLDGSKTEAEILTAPPHGFTKHQVERMLLWFRQQRLLADACPPPPAPALPWFLRVWNYMSLPDRWRVHLVNPDRFLERHGCHIDALFSRPALGIYVGLMLLPLLVYTLHPVSIDGAGLEPGTALSPWDWSALYGMMVLTNVLHEIAHAVACKHFGGRVPRIGLMLLYLHPVLYCDVSDSWRFRSSDRIVVLFAGVFLQIVLSALMTTVWLVTGDALFLVYVLSNMALVFYNLIPLVKLDGYWMLVSALDEPNLRLKGLEAVDRLVRRALNSPITQGDPPASPAVLAYGLGHIVAMALLWAMGLWGVVRISEYVPHALGWSLVTVALAPIGFRFWRAAWIYVRTLQT